MAIAGAGRSPRHPAPTESNMPASTWNGTEWAFIGFSLNMEGGLPLLGIRPESQTLKKWCSTIFTLVQNNASNGLSSLRLKSLPSYLVCGCLYVQIPRLVIGVGFIPQSEYLVPFYIVSKSLVDDKRTRRWTCDNFTKVGVLEDRPKDPQHRLAGLGAIPACLHGLVSEVFYAQ
ncbi:hypothetical protein M408DRAFT_6263 [Serendipita vermifera MAFF 305830]|uniref:Uncharacterized protein n=1 Tax=Serendipita vermifera MAFF 305830 TaxID=933852 RepID=A0A0C2X3R8_SERVB|nr:hypothetical protein M408DRAFT_6263 [Serendipita vermifera MAFF 305830]